MSNSKRKGNRSNGGRADSTEPKRSRWSSGLDLVDDSGICISAMNSSTEEEVVNSPTSRQTIEVMKRPIQRTDAGIIECVQLKNFMCHARLDFNFGSNVNFIVGQNGSGKSAVMTAIVVGLGGTAHCTNRGSAVKNFIMSGKQTAEVSISLRNCGPDAFKPEEYGARITVERRIAANGRNVYRLRGDTGRVISEKRDELIAMLDQFNIQVDNPVCILNQDASRNFLNSKNPKNKYKLFLKATQLDQIMQDYVSANAKRDLASNMIDQKAQWLPVLEKEVGDWRRKYELQQSLDGLREKAKRLRVLIAWAEFGNLEQEFKIDQDKLEAIRQQTPNLMEKVEKYKKSTENAKMRCDEIEAEMHGLVSEIENQESLVRVKKDEFTLKKQMQKNAKLECQKLMISIRSITKDHDSLKKRIQDMNTTDACQQMAEKQERLRTIAALEEKRVDTEAKCMTTEHHCHQLKNCNSRYKEELASVESEERRLRVELNSKRRELENLEGSRTNHLRRFGNYVPDLVHKVEQANRQGLFRQKPIGPLGAHVKLRETRYSAGVDACIRQLLYAFCCDNHADQRLLEKLFKEVAGGRGQRAPSMIVSKFTSSMHDISVHRVTSSKYPSILDVIDIDSHVVANCLIDQRSVEGVLLIESNAEARRVMQYDVPRNCREAFTASGDQVYPAPNFRYYSARNQRGSILQENVETVIASLQESIRILEQEHQAKVQRVSEIGREKATNANEIKVQEQQLMRMQQLIRETRHNIEKLQNVIDPETIGVNILEEDLSALVQQLANLNEDCDRAKANFERLKAEAEKVEKTFREITDQLKVLNSEKYDSLKESLMQSEATIQELANAERHFLEKLRQQLAVEKDQEEICASKLAEVEEWRIKCTEDFGPLVTSKHPLSRLKEQFTIIQQRLELDKEMRGDPIEIHRMYLEASTKYQRIKDDINDLKAFLVRLKGVMVQRERSYIERREYIAIRVAGYFTSTLELKKFKGSVRFDHDKESLEILVETSQAGELDNEKKSVQGLSGGERSFTTVSFMLALWQTIESPFRMMDEFDIFMDMVTRRISMDMILDFASTRVDNQFIVLTPLDMTKLHASDALRIFKMTDPDRCQAVLPFESSGRAGNGDADEEVDDS